MKNPKRIVNVIEMTDKDITSIDTFVMPEGVEPYSAKEKEIVQKAEKLFSAKALENGADKDDIEACIEDGSYDDGDYKVLIYWSNEKQTFAEVLIDFTDPETGNITLDCFMDDDPNSEGRVVAQVTPDGEVIKGTNPDVTESDLQDPLVIEAIKDAKSEQEDRKQELVDAVLEELKKDLAQGDFTVIDELLKFIPTRNLIMSLPEEKWADYPIDLMSEMKGS